MPLYFKMFAAMVDVKVKPGSEDDFKAWIEESNKTLSKSEGFVFRRLYRGSDGSLRVVAKFDSAEQFDAMRGTEEHKNFRKKAAEFLAEEPTVVKYTSIAG